VFIPPRFGEVPNKIVTMVSLEAVSLSSYPPLRVILTTVNSSCTSDLCALQFCQCLISVMSVEGGSLHSMYLLCLLPFIFLASVSFLPIYFLFLSLPVPFISLLPSFLNFVIRFESRSGYQLSYLISSVAFFNLSRPISELCLLVGRDSPSKSKSLPTHNSYCLSI
jgi:hypothetical protein